MILKSQRSEGIISIFGGAWNYKNIDFARKPYYTNLMYTKILSLFIMSFLFAQVTCAMSEGADLFLEISEHSGIVLSQHDNTSEQHDEVSEHQDIMSGVSHCIHSHPPLTLIFNETGFDQERSEAYFINIGNQNLISIVHRPPISPPIA